MDLWPIKGQMPELAWGVPDNLTATAVPLHQQDIDRGTLDLEQYRWALVDRLLWLLQQEDDPAGIVRWLETLLDEAGVIQLGQLPHEPEQALIDLAHHPSLLWVLCQSSDLPAFPVTVRRMEEAVEVIRETGLEEWLQSALPSDGHLD